MEQGTEAEQIGGRVGVGCESLYGRPRPVEEYIASHFHRVYLG